MAKPSVVSRNGSLVSLEDPGDPRAPIADRPLDRMEPFEMSVPTWSKVREPRRQPSADVIDSSLTDLDLNAVRGDEARPKDWLPDIVDRLRRVDGAHLHRQLIALGSKQLGRPAAGSSQQGCSCPKLVPLP